jgi:hypothetical protein
MAGGFTNDKPQTPRPPLRIVELDAFVKEGDSIYHQCAICREINAHGIPPPKPYVCKSCFDKKEIARIQKEETELQKKMGQLVWDEERHLGLMRSLYCYIKAHISSPTGQPVPIPVKINK